MSNRKVLAAVFIAGNRMISCWPKSFPVTKSVRLLGGMALPAALHPRSPDAGRQRCSAADVVMESSEPRAVFNHTHALCENNLPSITTLAIIAPPLKHIGFVADGGRKSSSAACCKPSASGPNETVPSTMRCRLM